MFKISFADFAPESRACLLGKNLKSVSEAPNANHKTYLQAVQRREIVQYFEEKVSKQAEEELKAEKDGFD